MPRLPKNGSGQRCALSYHSCVNPSLYQLNTRVYVSSLGRNATIDQIPDSFLDQLTQRGFDWLWLLGVWKLGPRSRQVSRSTPAWRTEYQRTLPDLSDADITGSPFAICEYTVDPVLGGDAALARFRTRLAQRGINLMLDFVPNHVGLDHSWITAKPEYLIQGRRDGQTADPARWCTLETGQVFAFGRDPNYPGWPDTLQLNYYNHDLRAAMRQELSSIASRCDGVRCDMAMLLEPEIFHRTWGPITGSREEDLPLFWPDAIETTRRENPKFLFVAEVYWNYEYKLQQHGFDYTYDKTLYDRVIHRNGPYLRGHLIAPLSYQGKMVRFLENHDEERIASRLSIEEHRAAAVVTFLAPGLRLFHNGQLEGNTIRIPVHLSRGPRERPRAGVEEIYRSLLPIINSPAGKRGSWNLLDTRPAWAANPTNENFICYLIEHPLQTLLVSVNYASYRGQCFVRIPDRTWLHDSLEFRDLLSHERLVRIGSDLLERGLFLDCDAWQSHIFVIDHP